MAPVRRSTLINGAKHEESDLPDRKPGSLVPQLTFSGFAGCEGPHGHVLAAQGILIFISISIVAPNSRPGVVKYYRRTCPVLWLRRMGRPDPDAVKVMTAREGS